MKPLVTAPRYKITLELEVEHCMSSNWPNGWCMMTIDGMSVTVKGKQVGYLRPAVTGAALAVGIQSKEGAELYQINTAQLWREVAAAIAAIPPKIRKQALALARQPSILRKGGK